MTDPADPCGLEMLTRSEMCDQLNHLGPLCSHLEKQLKEAARRDRYHIALLEAYKQLHGAVEEWDDATFEPMNFEEKDLMSALQRFHRQRKEIKDEYKRDSASI